MQQNIRYLRTLIIVKDITTSNNFYSGLLGQKVLYDFGTKIIFESGFGILSAEATAQYSIAPANDSRPSQTVLYFETDDIESFANNIQNNKIDVIHGLQEQPWRQKVIRLLDPDKNVIEFGETIERLILRLSAEGNDTQTICSITGLCTIKVSNIINPSPAST